METKKKQVIMAYIQELTNLYINIQTLEKANIVLKHTYNEHISNLSTIEQDYNRRTEELEKIIASLDCERARLPQADNFKPQSFLKRNLRTFLILFISTIGSYAVGRWLLSCIIDINSVILGLICSVVAFCIALYINPLDTMTTEECETHHLEYCQKSHAQYNKRREYYDEQVRIHQNPSLQQLLDNERLRAELIQQQISHNSLNISAMQQQLVNYYALDILPPDYRTMDCVITLDHIYRNDLADTIRDAILMYKEWVFRGDILQGMDNIIKMLGNLSAQMQYMQQTLDSIDATVSSMCSDMHRMIELQVVQNNTQEQILRETQCTRQATIAIQHSNEKYEWYVEQHRQGVL